MWILDEAMHNTEHNPRRHWHKTLILAEGKTIEKKDFLMFFISKLNLILIDHKLSALGKKNKGGKTHTEWLCIFEQHASGVSQVNCKSFTVIPHESLHIYVLMSCFVCCHQSWVSQLASHIIDQTCCASYEWIMKSFYCLPSFYILLILQAAGSDSGVALLCAKTGQGEISLWVECRVSKQQMRLFTLQRGCKWRHQAHIGFTPIKFLAAYFIV